MTDKDYSDKIKIKALLETYSAKEIADIFTRIDNKLISLHECSSDDFLKLNNDFKYLYKQSKIISENVNDVFDIFNTQKTQQLYNQVHSFYDNLKNQLAILDQKINVIIDFLKDLTNKLRFAFFPLKNYGQNLMSFKYLLANLNISYSLPEKTNQILEITKNIEESIYELKKILEKAPKILNHLRKVAKISISNISETKELRELNVDTILNEIKNHIEIIDSKYKENTNCIPVIRGKNEKSADNISDIIKKLQYQDIIRQKMEHIQKTHNGLIQELYEFDDKTENEKHLNDKAKFFLRIRDISGLQAAQLIQANKEYQSAIDIIINNFMQIGDNMKDISEMCGKIADDGDDNDNQLFTEIKNQIISSEEKFNQKLIQHKKINKDLSTIEHQIGQSEKLFSVLNELNENLTSHADIYFNELKTIKPDDSESEEAISQANTLFNDIKQNSNRLTEFIDGLSPIKKRIHNFINTEGDIDIKDDFQKIKNIVNQIQNIRLAIDKKLKDNNTIGNDVLNSIKKSISGIKYYDYFEKIIEEIISELNTVNYNLKIESDEILSKEENLKEIKSFYTMKTEHDIHDQIAKGEDAQIELEEDGDIEFF